MPGETLDIDFSYAPEGASVPRACRKIFMTKVIGYYR